ncbi:MAG: F420-dependent NADP oxidoreductase [Planctomycetota bacterium]|nr:F420-dependent NADP oxidoreductase [Planctomycetota bacterium]MDI6787240.1 F420-dependent NADP oxidoreductase [Planctomycetota bacterium]
MQKVVIIGCGQVGQTLGSRLQKSGKYKVIGVWSKKSNNGNLAARFIGRNVKVFKDKKTAVQQADIVFITTPDSAIQQTCNDIFADLSTTPNAFGVRDKTVIHCSGSFPSSILNSARRYKNVRIASLHPLQTFANKVETAKNFKGTYCVYESESKALKTVKGIINAIGGIPVEIKSRNKTLYHIGCVFASNYLVTVINVARNFLKRSGFSDKDALESIQPLINSTVKNIRTLGIPTALTGPIARGDVLTIRKHLKAIKKEIPLYLPLYRELGEHTIKIAKAKKSVSIRQLTTLQKEL